MKARAGALRDVSLGIFFLALVLENPKERPAMGRWSSPIRPLGELFYENLNTVTGISALRFGLLDLLLIGMVGLCFAVRPRGGRASPPPDKLYLWLRVAFVAVLWLELMGLARGGDFKSSLWQLRQLLFLPALAFVFSSTLEIPRDLPALGRIVVVAALIKAALVMWFYEMVCRPIGFKPSYASTHSDTLLFVGAIVILCTRALELRSKRAWVHAAVIFPVLFVAILMNNRRLALIDLLVAALLIWIQLPRSRATRKVRWAAIVASPFVVLYLVIGAHLGSALFAPARSFATLFSGTDRSAGTRDIENWNLLQTWKQNLLFGSGFGHEYLELSKADSIAEVFPLYRYIGHNSVLWLFSVGGLLGFALIWTPLLLGVFFAMRAHRSLAAPLDRAAALTALCMLCAFAIQAWGDMGLHSWPGVFLSAVAIAIGGKLAVAGGVVPAAARGSMRVAAAPSAEVA